MIAFTAVTVPKNATRMRRTCQPVSFRAAPVPARSIVVMIVVLLGRDEMIARLRCVARLDVLDLEAQIPRAMAAARWQGGVDAHFARLVRPDLDDGLARLRGRNTEFDLQALDAVG